MIRKNTEVSEESFLEEGNDQKSPSGKRAGNKGWGVTLFLITLTIASTGAAAFFWRELQAIKNDPQSVAREETRSLVASVGKLMDLPDGEDPTIATVSDPERLKDQPFFAKAKVGDRVLIYTNARKAILYDPTRNKIIDVAPINIGSVANTESVEPVPPEEVESEETSQ